MQHLILYISYYSSRQAVREKGVCPVSIFYKHLLMDWLVKNLELSNYSDTLFFF